VAEPVGLRWSSGHDIARQALTNRSPSSHRRQTKRFLLCALSETKLHWIGGDAMALDASKKKKKSSKKKGTKGSKKK
jgi:hypothetical protein